MTTDSVPDKRETEHIECDCVPDLGPSHCHLCSVKAGREMPWTEAHPIDPVPAHDLDPYPYKVTNKATGAWVTTSPGPWCFPHEVSTFKPDPEYSQNPADYGVETKGGGTHD